MAQNLRRKQTKYIILKFYKDKDLNLVSYVNRGYLLPNPYLFLNYKLN